MQDIPQDALIEIVSRAGDAILEIYSGDFEVLDKADQSPLTQADLAAHEIIVQGLAAVTPNVPVISEESVAPDFSVRSQWDVYWLVDPLDGTKEFVNRNGEFTVNIALIKGGATRLRYCWCARAGLYIPGQRAGATGLAICAGVICNRSKRGK